MKHLFSIRGFLPFLAIAFLNVSVDLAHKITIQNVLLKSFSEDTLIILSAVVNAMILLPFIFLFSPAGFVNDRFSKTKVIQISSLAGLFISIMVLICYIFGWFKCAFGLTLALAIQSAFYSPAKYGIIKNLVGTEKLGLANGMVQALSIIGLLLSSLGFSMLFEALYKGGITPEQILKQIYVIGIFLVLFSALEVVFAFQIPFFDTEKETSKQIFDIKKYATLTYLKENLKIIKKNNDIWLSIVGLSIFWGISQVILSAFPAHFKAITGGDNAVVIQTILAVSTIGLIIGSWIAGNASKDHIELGIIPFGALGMFVSLFIFSTSSKPFIMGLSSMGFGFFGGLLIVPLNATIQFFAPSKDTGKILAGNNFIQNIAMIAFLILSVVFIKLNISTLGLFLFTSSVALAGALYSILQVPHLFTRLLLLPILKTNYKFHVKGLKNLPQKGGVLLLGNHISWIDWLVLQVASPRAIKFVMYRGIYSKWYLTWFLRFFKTIPIGAGASKESIRAIKEKLNNGEVVAIFPEGQISYNGQFSTFQRGFELALKDTNCKIVPFYLRGLWGSSFSRATKYYKELTNKRGKRHIIVAFGEPLENNLTAQEVKAKVTELSFLSWESFIESQEPLMYSWINMAKSNLTKICSIDAMSGSLSNAKFITGVLIFSKLLRRELKDEKHIGIVLPSSSIAAIINMALFIMGKVPINLNYTLSEDALKSALKKANIKKVITSKTFLEKLKTKGFDFENILSDYALYAEDLKQNITPSLKVISAIKAYVMPSWLIRALDFEEIELNDTATILFSSGSEGEPKGIVLTHKNLLTNIKQVSELLNFRKDDVILNSLPIFHSFGLTVTTLMPLCEGVKMVSVPDPTDGVSVGKMTAKHGASILFGTSTFFRLYARNKKLHPLMFASIRMVVAGAEKLKPEVKQAFKLKFGLEIQEGYGTTETAPVASVNMPNVLEPTTLQELTFNKAGSIGMPLPGTIVKIVDPDTLAELKTEEDGLIIIGGGQVMKEYLNDKEKTDEVIVQINGTRYYKTGDKGHIDEDGFIYIVDRYSRFAKIGGEMISLGSVEEKISPILGEESPFVAVNVPDEKKGEAVALLVKSELEIKQIADKLKASTLSPLMMPTHLFLVDELPTLGSGKTDFKKAKSMALEILKSK